MKKKIAYRLVGYFSAVLIVFSTIVGFLFVLLFSRYTIELNKRELMQRAATIAGQFSGFLEPETDAAPEHQMCQGMGYKTYIRVLDDIAMSKVWVVNKDADTINIMHGNHQILYDELPEGTDHIIQWIFQGETSYGSEFSSFLKTPTITAGAPIYAKNGEIIAAVLLHTDVDGIGDGIRRGVFLLIISLGLSLVIVFFISIFLSLHFVVPLKKMKQITELLVQGNYEVKTDIQSKDEIGQLAKSIDVLSIRLKEGERESEKLEKMRNDFISNISHELRTPITVIRGSVEALYGQGREKTDEEMEYLYQIKMDTLHLQRLVTDLLELSKLENPDFKMEMEDIDLIQVLEDALRFVRQLAIKKNISLNLDKDIHGFLFWGDYGRLRQMFINILENAIKFSNEDTAIKIEIKSNAKGCQIEITDFGIGIKKDDLPFIFDQFHYIKSSHNQSGTGLGLSIVKQIAKRHDIAIRSESKPSEFTTFFFEFLTKQVHTV